MKIRALMASLFAACSFSAQAGTATWIGGGVDDYWSTTANWQGGRVPGPGDRVIIGPQTRTVSSINDIVSTLDGIETHEPGFYFSIDLSNNRIFIPTLTLTGAAPISHTATTGVNHALVLGNTTLANPNARVEVNGDLNIYGLNITGHPEFHLDGNAESGFGVAFFGPIIETGRTTLTFTGTGLADFLRTTGTILTGGITSSLPKINIVSDIGSSNAPLSVPGDSTLNIGTPGVKVIAWPIIFRSGGTSTGTLQVDSPLELRGGLTVQSPLHIQFYDSGVLTLGGPTSATAPITEDGDGTLLLSNNGGTFTTINANGTTRSGLSEVISDNASLNIGGTYDLGANVETLGSLTCTQGTIDAKVPQAQFIVNGTASIGGCTLSLTADASYVPTAASPITLIHGSKPASGMFNGLAEGAIVKINGVSTVISYKGGSSGSDVVLSLATATPVAQVQDMWWVGTSENGWGMSLIQHDDRLFGALYIYDAVGNPTWIVMSGGTWDATHTIFTGPLYEPKGTPFYAYDTTHFVVGNQLGNLVITFQDSSHATLDYTVGSLSGHKAITREIFDATALAGTDRTDLWWGGESQNGWGVTITQQGQTLFPIWYTYGATGSPMWYFMTDGTWNATKDTYSGNMYRATGSPWVGATYDPTKLIVTKAGTFSIAFTTSGATFNYNADGHSGSSALVRQPF